jgi:hypothetical protein
MKRSISIINTGIQLINVIEAVQNFECQDNYLIIGQFNIFPDRIKQIEKMLEDEYMNRHFKKIYSMPKQFSPGNPLRFFGYMLAYFKFAFIILFSKKFNYCFSGVYTDIIQRPINFLSYYKNRNICLCLVDEGVRIMEDAKNRFEQLPKLTIQDKKKVLFFRDFFLAITKHWLPPTLCYFTVYDLPLLARDRQETNRYLFLQKNNIYCHNFEKEAVVIIGQPYTELNMISEISYSKIIMTILNEWKDYPCCYVPHPMEIKYKEWLPQNLLILKTQYPIELLLIGANIRALVGFHSSVLFNAAKMNICDAIVSYVINPQDYINSYNPPAMERLYDSFQKVGIKITDL